jgi:P4 family phage/plasmid primase-like protien
MFQKVQSKGQGFNPIQENEVLGVGLLPSSINAVVFDLDAHPGKPNGVKYADRELNLPPHTYTQTSATGGRHVFLRKRENVSIGNKSPWEKWGIDIRADNGWIVAAGTTTQWGAWEIVPNKPRITELALVPDNLWKILVGKKNDKQQGLPDQQLSTSLTPLVMPDKLKALISDLNVKAGERSDRFHHIVCECKRSKLTQVKTIEILSQWVDAINYDKYSGRVQEMVLQSWSKSDDEGNNNPAQSLDPFIFDTDQPASPERYIFADGLHVADLGNDILRTVPLRRDLGDSIWIYRNGVWTPDDKSLIRTLVVNALGNRSRPAHTNAIEHYLRGIIAIIEPAPQPHFINVQNGHLDWQTGNLNPHDPEALSTVQLNTMWNPKAECPIIESWLSEVLPADLLAPTNDSPGFIWEVIGYLCMSGNQLHKAVLLLGSGRNGKGTFLRLIHALLGDKNVSQVDIHSLMSNRFRVADLFGKVANIAGDIDGSYLESTAMFKAITGGDRVTAERKYGQPFSFEPFAVPVYSANNVFGTPDTSTGYMSRWLVIPFPNEFLGKEDRNLDAVLQQPEQIEGMLVKSVSGLRALIERGNFTTPPSITEAFDKFADASDPVRAFMRDVSQPADDFVSRDKVWRVYEVWASENGQKHHLSRTKLYDRLEAAGWSQKKTGGTRGFAGRTLTVCVVDGDYPGIRHLEPFADDRT